MLRADHYHCLAPTQDTVFFDLLPPTLLCSQEDAAAGQAFEGQSSGGSSLLQSWQHLHTSARL